MTAGWSNMGSDLLLESALTAKDAKDAKEGIVADVPPVANQSPATPAPLTLHLPSIAFASFASLAVTNLVHAGVPVRTPVSPSCTRKRPYREGRK